MDSRQISFRCSSCGARFLEQPAACPECGHAPVGRLFGVSVGGTLTPKGSLEVVADNPIPGGSSVQYVSPGGMHSHSTFADGEVQLTLSAPIDIGRGSDEAVADRVVAAMRNEGHRVEIFPHRDDHGEDRRIRCDDRELTIQVVGVPANSAFLGEASRGSATTRIPTSAAASWVADAITLKANKYSPEVRFSMVLAVDIRAIGVLASVEIVKELETTHVQVLARAGFAGAWLSGPSDSRSTRIPSMSSG